ncbi:MAG TPA: TonB-dependent receptor [Sphingomicrobium sp.]|nr:TonB-dependent receptor [Sphingomicrobium sp.]
MIQAIDSNEIVITATRTPEEAGDVAASVSTIDKARIDRLGEPLVPALLRLTPGLGVSTSGPAGSITEVRIRGAEAYHTLLFVDGIKVNDPATGNAPRFELLNADLASRIEVVRGPQSALWGSEAIGGVISVDGDPLGPSGGSARAEAGSFGFFRSGASGSIGGDALNLSAAAGWQRATGINSFDGPGDRDGYRNLSGRARLGWAPSDRVDVTLNALALTGKSQFDGFDPVTFNRADTLDNSRFRLLAAGIVLRAGNRESGLSGHLSASALGSSNRNFLADQETNRTGGSRWVAGGQIEYRLKTGPVDHKLIAAADHEREEFRARDTIYFGSSNQDRSRERQSLTAEWRADAGFGIADLAVRRDHFNRFGDATSLRASLLGRLGGGFSLAASYAEGIAQPTFFDLYGFSPAFFVGNPDLKPETSRGFDMGVRYRGQRLTGSLTWHRQRLKDEIVERFDLFPSTTENRAGKSRRSGLEAEFGWSVGDTLRLTAAYAYLDATELNAAGTQRPRERRRPKHSGSLAVDGATGPLTYGASLAYVGAHLDQRDSFPYDIARLGSYWLAGARLAYRVSGPVELFARASNLFDARYTDAVGYRTEGRGVHAGLRIASRR